jgi:hypothetical protein
MKLNKKHIFYKIIYHFSYFKFFTRWIYISCFFNYILYLILVEGFTLDKVFIFQLNFIVVNKVGPLNTKFFKAFCDLAKAVFNLFLSIGGSKST